MNRLEDTDNIKNSFEITGPMIERIVVQCLTRTESLRWVEILRQQIKCARTNSSLNPGSTSHPMPPPHVSPPFVDLTFWIREALNDGRLSMSIIKEMTADKVNLEPERPLSPWRLRKIKSEIFFEPTIAKREALFQDEHKGNFSINKEIIFTEKLRIWLVS